MSYTIELKFTGTDTLSAAEENEIDGGTTGTISKFPDDELYDALDVVQIYAVLPSGYEFEKYIFTDTAAKETNPCEYTVSADDASDGVITVWCVISANIATTEEFVNNRTRNRIASRIGKARDVVMRTSESIGALLSKNFVGDDVQDTARIISVYADDFQEYLRTVQVSVLGGGAGAGDYDFSDNSSDGEEEDPDVPVLDDELPVWRPGAIWTGPAGFAGNDENLYPSFPESSAAMNLLIVRRCQNSLFAALPSGKFSVVSGDTTIDSGGSDVDDQFMCYIRWADAPFTWNRRSAAFQNAFRSIVVDGSPRKYKLEYYGPNGKIKNTLTATIRNRFVGVGVLSGTTGFVMNTNAPLLLLFPTKIEKWRITYLGVS